MVSRWLGNNSRIKEQKGYRETRQAIIGNIISTYYSTKFWGTDYLLIKGMFIVMTCQSLIWNIFGVLAGNERLIQGVSGNYVHASAAGFGGLMIGFVLKKFLFKE